MKGENIDYQVEAHPRRQTHQRSLAKHHWTKQGMTFRDSQQLNFRQTLSFAVIRCRGIWQVLRHRYSVEIAFPRGRVVDGTRGGEKEPCLASLFRRFLRYHVGQLAGGVDIAFVVQSRREVRGGIIGESGEMDHGIDVFQPMAITFANISFDDFETVMRFEGISKPQVVDYSDMLAQREEFAHEQTANIASTACHQNHQIDSSFFVPTCCTGAKLIWPFLEVEVLAPSPFGRTEASAAGMSDGDWPRPQFQAGTRRTAAKIHVVELKGKSLIKADIMV